MKNQTTSAQAENPLGTAPVGSLIAKFAIPAIISMLVSALYNIVDQIFIGQGVGMLAPRQQTAGLGAGSAGVLWMSGRSQRTTLKRDHTGTDRAGLSDDNAG